MNASKPGLNDNLEPSSSSPLKRAVDHDAPSDAMQTDQPMAKRSRQNDQVKPMPHPYFEDEYNEESDGDWAEEESDHDSESDIGSDEELIHAALSLDKNRKHSDSDQQPDQEDQIEEIILPWESFTEEEKEDIRQDARKIGFMKFFDKYAIERREPIARLLEAFGLDLPPHVIVATQAIELAKVLRSIVTRYLRKRDRLDNVNTLQDVVQLIRDAKKIMIVTGAGVSVSCGIPDFRSESGIYSRLQEYELDDPQQMFDIDYFREMPEIFYSFAREVYPGKYEPSPSHVFVKLVEDKGKLLRNYTQNIDTLEHKVGINNLVNCHGSFATASCVTCDYKCQGKDIEDAIYQQMVPPCPKCASAPSPVKPASNVSDDEDAYDPPRGVSIMKPDITFFGEKLPDEFDRLLAIDTEQVDLLIVMGSSLKVAPVSDIMTHIPHSVPQILINRTPITHMTFDVQLLGNSDDIVPELCRMLDWDLKHTKLPGGSALSDESKALSRIPNDIVLPLANQPPPSDHMWTFVQNGLYVFPGAVFDPKLLKCDERGQVQSDDDSHESDEALLDQQLAVKKDLSASSPTINEITDT